jgi:c-di-GMP-binding flagellar brake protein YcgR
MSAPTPPPAGAERRRGFRIEDAVYLDYRVVAAEEQEIATDEADRWICSGLMQLRELSQQAGHVLANIRKYHSEVAQYLALLDKKIDTLAQMTAAVGLGSEVRPSTRVNISAGGLAFAQPQPLELDTRLALKLVLFPSHLCLQLKARVVYCHRADEGGEVASYWTGIEFDPLPEAEQDALIRHLLEKQSAQRRREREGE